MLAALPSPLARQPKPPPPSTAAATTVTTKTMVQPEQELRILAQNEALLRLSGYYYGALEWRQANKLLSGCGVGTFLVRSSEHPLYLYTLSVSTSRGPTSCRVDYRDGAFRLDAAQHLVDKMPTFDSVTALVDYYVALSRRKKKHEREGRDAVWVDLDERTDNVPVAISRPRYKEVRSLLHMCCVSLVRTMRDNGAQDSESQKLPRCVRQYLGEYPHAQ